MSALEMDSLTKIWMIQSIVEGLDEDLDLINNLYPPLGNEGQDTEHLLRLADQEQVRLEYVDLMKHRSQSSGYRRKKQGEHLKEVLQRLHGVNRDLLKDTDAGKDKLIKIARRRQRSRVHFHDVVKKTILELDTDMECVSMKQENQIFKKNNEQLSSLFSELTALEDEIERIRKQRDSTRAKTNSEKESSDVIIENLKNTISKLSRQLEVENPLKIKHREASLASTKRLFGNSESTVENDVNSTQTIIDKEKKKHNETKTYVSNKGVETKDGIAHWKQVGAEDLVTLQTEHVAALERAKLAEEQLQEMKDRLVKEKKWITDRRFAAEEAKRMYAVRYMAAVRIQKLIRGFLCRKKMRDEKKKKKGKKKGKGKKSKK